MNLLDLLIAPAHAAAGAPQPSPWSLPIMMILFFVVFWFFLIRPQMKRAKEHREMVSKLNKGDEVIIGGGIAGRIDDLGESFVSVEIANDVSVRVQRNAIQTVLPKGTLKSA
ncbi:MAG: preprotein translocase subunit YajC [Lysobacteraceae bacterium]